MPVSKELRVYIGVGPDRTERILNNKNAEDPISLDPIKREPGKAFIIGNWAFNKETIDRLFRNVLNDDYSTINLGISDIEEFLIGIKPVFSTTLRFINYDAVVREDLRDNQLPTYCMSLKT